MAMRVLSLIQGEANWLRHRRQPHMKNASEVGAMLGEDPYITRTELMRRKKYGIWPEPTREEQKRFNEGHRTERLARPLGEQIVGDDLSPIVGVITFDAGQGELSASFDGITLGDDPTFEHKLLNDEIRAALPHIGIDSVALNDPSRLPLRHRGQMEQQQMVSGATRTLFMASAWTEDGQLIEFRACWYYSDPALRARIVAGWKQWDVDFDAFTEEPKHVEAQAQPMETLPAVLVEMKGELRVESNLDKVDAVLTAFLERLPAKPSTDEEFATTDAACKALEVFEKSLAAELQRALRSIEDVAQLQQRVTALLERAKTARKAREDLVKGRKDEIRLEHIQRGQREVSEYLAALNKRIGKEYMPKMPPELTDFASAISGVRKYDNIAERIKAKVNTFKIEASIVADRIQQNLRHLAEHKDYAFLFPDERTLVLKEEDDFKAAVRARILQHQEAERTRREEAQRREAAAPVVQDTPAQDPVRAPLDASRDARTSYYSSGLGTKPPAQLRAGAEIVPLRRSTPAQRSPEDAKLRLGVINERLAPVMVNGDGLAKLGFTHARKEKTALLYYEEDWPAICDAVSAHVQSCKQPKAVA